MPSSSDEMETNSLLTGCTPSSPSVRDIIKDPYKTASDNFMLSTKSTLNKAVSDTVNANTITSLAEVTHKINSWNQDQAYIPWSSGDTALSVWTSSTDTKASSSEVLTDSGDLWNESSSDSTEFMLNWLKDIPDDPVPVENKEEKWWLTTPTLSEPIYTSESAVYARSTHCTSSMSVCSDKTDEEIPFDPPIVSKFGPISRSCKTKYKSTDPVQATANQDYVRQELSRLERQAQNAYTEGEALNCELKAVELQISLEDGSMFETPHSKPEKTIFGWELESKLERPPAAWSSFEMLAAATTKGMVNLFMLLKFIDLLPQYI
uniref:Uncharacterized protein n=1 Tax=Magallana gigas TaxID=29159 RepID=K1PEZ2_MAGGI